MRGRRRGPGTILRLRTLPQRDPTRHDSTTWAYQLQPTGTGTQLTHSYEITIMPSPPLRALYGILLPQQWDMRPQMLQSLQTLKTLLEHNPHP
jgi:hypothetical protein